MSDATFIAHFLPRYPDWKERPGATDTLMIIEIVRELGVAARGETFTEYDHVLAEHRAGHGALLTTTHAPEQIEPVSGHRSFVMLLVEMDNEHFTAWRPFSSGLSDTLPRASRIWWERWQTSALVLYSVDAVAP